MLLEYLKNSKSMNELSASNAIFTKREGTEATFKHKFVVNYREGSLRRQS